MMDIEAKEVMNTLRNTFADAGKAQRFFLTAYGEWNRHARKGHTAGFAKWFESKVATIGGEYNLRPLPLAVAINRANREL